MKTKTLMNATFFGSMEKIAVLYPNGRFGFEYRYGEGARHRVYTINLIKAEITGREGKPETAYRVLAGSYDHEQWVNRWTKKLSTSINVYKAHYDSFDKDPYLFLYSRSDVINPSNNYTSHGQNEKMRSDIEAFNIDEHDTIDKIMKLGEVEKKLGDIQRALRKSESIDERNALMANRESIERAYIDLRERLVAGKVKNPPIAIMTCP